jgi:hypothetical protein
MAVRVLYFACTCAVLCLVIVASGCESVESRGEQALPDCAISEDAKTIDDASEDASIRLVPELPAVCPYTDCESEEKSWGVCPMHCGMEISCLGDRTCEEDGICQNRKNEDCDASACDVEPTVRIGLVAVSGDAQVTVCNRGRETAENDGWAVVMISGEETICELAIEEDLASCECITRTCRIPHEIWQRYRPEPVPVATMLVTGHETDCDNFAARIDCGAVLNFNLD